MQLRPKKKTTLRHSSTCKQAWSWQPCRHCSTLHPTTSFAMPSVWQSPHWHCSMCSSYTACRKPMVQAWAEFLRSQELGKGPAASGTSMTQTSACRTWCLITTRECGVRAWLLQCDLRPRELSESELDAWISAVSERPTTAVKSAKIKQFDGQSSSIQATTSKIAHSSWAAAY